MNTKNEFLEKLATLIEQYDAILGYTTDDDGIHIDVNGEEIYTGWINGKDGAESLRNAKDYGFICGNCNYEFDSEKMSGAHPCPKCRKLTFYEET